MIWAVPPGELNVEAVRDLLGIVRALWGAAEQRGDSLRAEMLRRAGVALKEALKLARRPDATPAQLAAARRSVDRAIECMGESVTWMSSLGDVLGVAESRALGGSVRRTDAMERRLNRVKRG